MAFEVVDTQSLADFKKLGEQYVQDFAKIKTDFETYNRDFLATYDGRGADKYNNVSKLIMEKVSDFEAVFKIICEEIINPILKNFEDLDKYLKENNDKMKAEEVRQDGDGTN